MKNKRMTIKEAAGKILLIMYSIQTANPMDLEQEQILFEADSEPKLESGPKFEKMLHGVSEDDSILYNAVVYLLEKDLITKRNQEEMWGGLLLIGPHVTHTGIDIIESVEQGEEGQKNVKALFNFSLNFSSTMKVDSLIKAEVGNIVGVGGAINGKVDL